MPATTPTPEERKLTNEEIAEQLRNTNLIEEMVRDALPPEEIPPTLPTPGKAPSAKD